MPAQQDPAGEELAFLARREVRKYEELSCVAALFAACSSPATVHRLPTWSLLLTQALAGQTTGEATATPDDVLAWAAALRRGVPAIAGWEGGVTLHPGRLVQVFWDGRMWPLHPGLSTAPEDVVERIRRYAAAADPELIERLGFGISDVLSLGLQVMSLQHASGFHAWRSIDVADADAETVSRHEVDAALGFLSSIRQSASSDALPVWLIDTWRRGRADRMLAAAQWCTRRARDLPDGGWLLDGALLIEGAGGLWPVPAGLALAGIEESAHRLLAIGGNSTVSGNGREATTRRLIDDAHARFATSVHGLPTSLVGPVSCGRSGRLTGALFPAARRLVVVQIVGGIDERSTAREVDRAKRRLAWVKPGAMLSLDVPEPAISTLDLAGGTPFTRSSVGARSVQIRADVEVRRVALVAGPWREPDEHRAGPVVLTLETWCQIVAASPDDAEEVWAFLDELALLPGLRKMSGADTLDLWQAFRRDGLLYDPFTEDQPTIPDRRDLWAARAAADPYEIVLRSAGLPGLREWPYASPVINDCVTVGSINPYEHVLVTAHPALALVIDGDTVEEREWMQLLAQSILESLTQLAESTTESSLAGWRAWVAAIQGRPLRVHFRTLPADSPHILKLLMTDGSMAVIGFTRPDAAAISPEGLHTLIGEALWSLLVGNFAQPTPTAAAEYRVIDVVEVSNRDPAAEAAGQAFQRAWSALPVNAMFVRTDSPRQPVPQGVGARLTNGVMARARRNISKTAWRSLVGSEGIDDREQFLSQVMLPAALASLRERIAQFDPAQALRAAATEVERIWALRNRADQDRSLRLAVGWRRLPDADSTAVEHTVATKSADLVIEAILHDLPHGRGRLDQRDWTELVGLTSHLLRMAGEREESRAGVRGDAEHDPSGRSVSFDAGAYARTRLAAHDRRIAQDLPLRPQEQLALAVAEGPTSPFISWTDVTAGAARAARAGSPQRREWESALRADEALWSNMGMGFDEFFAVLAVAGSWQTSTEVAEVTTDALAQQAHQWSGLDQNALHRAIEQLTLTSRVVRAEGLHVGRSEGRGARLSLRPLLSPAGDPGAVLIMPRRIDAAGHLLLAYITSARLPWPNLPKPISAALSAWAGDQQIAFEVEVEQAAKGPNRKLIPRLRQNKARKRGLTISGEIDLIVIDTMAHRVWVVEAKAGHAAVDADKLMHDIVEFHGVPTGSSHPRWRDYYGKKPFVAKLLAKTDEIRQQLVSLLASANVTIDGPWTVHPLFVTPGEVPAAYVSDPQVPFVTLIDLPTLLGAGGTPPNGPFCL